MPGVHWTMCVLRREAALAFSVFPRGQRPRLAILVVAQLNHWEASFRKQRYFFDSR